MNEDQTAPLTALADALGAGFDPEYHTEVDVARILAALAEAGFAVVQVARMSQDQTTDREPTNASLIDANIDGTAAARSHSPRRAPWFYTPAAQAEWLRAYDLIVEMRGG